MLDLKAKFKVLERKIRSYYPVNRKMFERDINALRESVTHLGMQIELQLLENGGKFSFSHTGGGGG